MFESYEIILTKYGQNLISGIKLTLYITVCSILIGLVLGLLLAILKIYGNRFLKALASFYIDIIRGTPMVVQLFIIYYGIPSTGLVKFSPVFAAILGMGLNSAAYQAEYFRTGFLAIPTGQIDAALSLGMTRWKIRLYILLPQVIRITIPAWTNELIALTQYSSLAMMLTVMELTSVAKFIGSKTFLYIQSFTIITIIYVVISIIFTRLMLYFEKWDVVYSEPHFLYITNENTPTTAPLNQPNDVLYSKYQWNLPIIETEAGWGIGKGSENVIVAVVDTGADMTHPDLQGRLQPGYNVIDPASSPMDDVGHGTHVAGIIAALVNNTEGVAGMTWYNPVMPVKVLDETGAGNTYNVAQGIIWAADHGAKVINMSLGNYADANFLHDAIKYAYDKDIVLIAASGNDNTNEPGFPAAYPEVFAVSATDDAKNKASFSNFGDYIDVAAPGVNIASTYPHNQYAALSGTSMASPHVTALAALIRSANPQLKNTEVMEIMRRTAKDLGEPGKDDYYGYGQIDVVNALLAAEGHAVVESAAAAQSRYLPEWLSRELELIKRRFSL